MMKSLRKIAIVQSNYIPWKGYFDLIAAVDEFIFYDDVQFTKNDWRNRNKIKTPRGLEWMSVPVGQNIRRAIRDVQMPDSEWQQSHWSKLAQNYKSAPYFNEIAKWLMPLYMKHEYTHLSAMNREFIVKICDYLGIRTHFSNAWDYPINEGKTQRLVDLVRQVGGTTYVSGPAAKDYLEKPLFDTENIALEWFDYADYPQYSQLWGEFEHGVSIVDLLFNCGKDAPKFMKIGRL